MESDRSPHGIDIGLADAMTFQEVAGCVRAINLKTLTSTAALMDQPHVVKHATAIEQLGIELETTLLSGQRAPVKDAAGMMKQEGRLRIPDELCDLSGDLAVGDRYTLNFEAHVGVVTLGRYPDGIDETAAAIVSDLTKAGYLAEARADIRRWKAAKLVHNVTNAVELFAGTIEARAVAATDLANEARTVLKAAGYDAAAPSERTVDMSGWRVAAGRGIEPGQQSTWQSFVRGTSSEVDYLNGEVVRLGRLHGVPVPFNAAFQRAAAKIARDGSKPGSLDIAEVR